MDLPAFRYHSDPIASGSIVASEAECACCNTRRGFIYSGPAHCEAELDDALCPWCIADGSAHQKFDANFTDPAGFPDEIGQDVVAEITYRTPGFNAWQEAKWLTCCDDAAAFLEPVGYAAVWDFMLEPDKADAQGQRWHLKLAIKQLTKPVLP